MCFSATASFAAAALLSTIGALTSRCVRHRSDRPFAAIPWLFALQQGIEGAIWLTFEGDGTRFNPALTLVYAFFAHVFWPAYIPLSVWFLEPDGPRRRWLAVLTAAGVSVSLWLLYWTTAHGVQSRICGKHIEYVSVQPLATASALSYLAVTACSLLVSTHATVRLFGLLALGSFACAYLVYETWLVSVWCFFAAVLSAVVWLHFRSAQRLRRRPAH